MTYFGGLNCFYNLGKAGRPGLDVVLEERQSPLLCEFLAGCVFFLSISRPLRIEHKPKRQLGFLQDSHAILDSRNITLRLSLEKNIFGEPEIPADYRHIFDTVFLKGLEVSEVAK